MLTQELRLCFVGPMVGRTPGHITSQGMILADHFSAAGYAVLSASSALNRYARLLDILSTLARHRRTIDIQCLEVYGGPSFVVEDLASLLGRRLGQRIVMTLHGGGLPEFIARFPGWARRVLRRADLLITPSAYLARAVEPYGFRAQVVPNVIDLETYPYRHRRALAPRLFWMRAFHPIWNPAMAVRVLARLRRARPDATLAMAGQDKGLLPEMRRLARELGVSDAICFPGFLDHAGKIDRGDASEIFLNTNRIDNMPVGVIEACALGLPVISTAVGGIPDLLTDAVTGLLVPDDDDAAMVAAIERLLGDPDLASRLSINGRQLAARSAWEQVRPQWERIFAELASVP